MPLLPTDLASGLEAMGFPSDAASAADGWTNAWWAYAKGCVQIAPPASEVLAKAAFKAAILPAFVPDQPPAAFFAILQLAMIAGWSATILLPLFASMTPASAPLDPLLESLVEPGKKSMTEDPPMQAFAAAVHLWTTAPLIGFLVIPVSGGPGVPLS